MSLSKSILLFFAGLFVFLGSCGYLGGVIADKAIPDSEVDSWDKPHLGYLQINGMILDAEPVLSQLDSLRKNKQLKGVLVRIESPGGAIGASQELYMGLKSVAKEIPVVISMGNYAASGGYYASLGATKIFALPGTVTASIGVITQFPHAEKLLNQLGIDFETVRSGKSKGIASPVREPTPEEISIMQGMIDDMYGQFLDAVKTHRDIPQDTLTKYADGRAMSGLQAHRIGLIDTLGSFRDALGFLQLSTKVSSETPLRQLKKEKSMLEKVIVGSTQEVMDGIHKNFSVGPAWKATGF